MKAHSVIFYAFEVTAALSAILILFTRNVFYGTLLLITCLLSIAGLFILLNAEFLAVAQILIYAGGVLVLIIFGVMLTSKFAGKSLMVTNKHWLPGIFAGIFFFGLLTKLYGDTSFQVDSSVPPESTHTAINQIGILLMSDYVLPFEVAGIVLLVALIGSAVVVSSFNSIKKL
jgi:NADH:ubiquinone oxidoreductase subunit 6 (subunit J)